MSKKILMVATVASHICQFHLPYLKMLKEEGYEIHAAARDNLAEKNGLKLKYVDEFVEIPFERSPFNKKNIKAYSQLKKLLSETYYDLIVCNTPMGGILTRLAARKTRKKGTKVVYIAHGFHFYKGASKKNWLLYYPIEKAFAKKCDVLITINEEDYACAKKKFKTRVEHIHGIGVSEERYFPATKELREKKRGQFGYAQEDFLILVVGELLPNKNQMQAFQALEIVVKKNPRVKMLLAGNGRMEQQLKDFVKEHGLTDHVSFLGYCTNLEEYQKMIDVGVSCSLREGMPLNVIETLMSGHVFVGTKNRGHNELIDHGKNGFLVDVGDYEKMAQALLMLAGDESMRTNMEKKATESIQVYALSRTIKEVEQIFKTILL